VEQSTRLSILEHALADVVERLGELPPSKDADSLRALAAQYETEMGRWEQNPPDEDRRQALLRSVLDLNVDVIRAGGKRSTMPDEDEADEDFPALSAAR